jgi:hypothetical protein
MIARSRFTVKKKRKSADIRIMYGDNYLPPDDSPFDWNGWGPIRLKEERHEEKAGPGSAVAEWRGGIESIVETAFTGASEQKQTMPK